MPRDVDSHINEREQAAVLEWQSQSQEPLHIMRDHPDHNTEILGGMFGLNLTRKNSRELWKQSWKKMVLDKRAMSSRSGHGPDQDLLTE